MNGVKLRCVMAAGLLACTGGLVSAQLAASGPGNESHQIDVAKMLDEKRVTLQDISGTTREATNALRQKYGVPIAFISVPNEQPESLNFRDERLSLRGALDECVRARPPYTYSVEPNQVILYPKSGPFEKVVREIDITNKPRLEAITAFVEYLKNTHGEFANLLPPGIKGDPEAPLYAEPVSTLRGKATVLEHFAALVGESQNATFSILDGVRHGTRLFVLEQVQSSEEKRRMEAEENSAREATDE